MFRCETSETIVTSQIYFLLECPQLGPCTQASKALLAEFNAQNLQLPQCAFPIYLLNHYSKKHALHITSYHCINDYIYDNLVQQ